MVDVVGGDHREDIDQIQEGIGSASVYVLRRPARAMWPYAMGRKITNPDTRGIREE